MLPNGPAATAPRFRLLSAGSDDVVTDPNVLAMPPEATIAQANGFALAMTRMSFADELDDVTDTVMSNWRMFP